MPDLSDTDVPSGRFDEILARWKRFREMMPEFFDQPEGESQQSIDGAQDSLGFPVPPGWRKFLRTIGACDLFYPLDIIVPEASALPQLQKDCLAWFQEPSGIPMEQAKQYLFIATRASGDMYALKCADRGSNDNCSVLLISHEGPAVEEEWSSIEAWLDLTVGEFEKLSPEAIDRIRKDGGMSEDLQEVLAELYGESDHPFAQVFSVVLQTIPADRKIQVMKAVRAITGAALADAQKLVANPPRLIAKNLTQYTAQEYARQLEAAGAAVLVNREK